METIKESLYNWTKDTEEIGAEVQIDYHSFGKLLEYVQCVSLTDLEVVKEDGGIDIYPHSDKFFLSPLFFRGDDCYRSGRCCRPYDISWTKADWERMQESSLREGVEPQSLEGYQEMEETGFEYQIVVNGKKVPLFLDPVTNKENKKKNMCDHLRYNDEGISYCAIRNINSITCRMPHSTIRRNKRNNATYFQKQQFGRNHQLQCPVRFKGFSLDNLKGTDIPLLERLDRTAADLGVKTIIPHVIKVVEGMMDKLSTGYLPLEAIEILPLEDEPHLESILEGIKWGREGQEPDNFRPEPSYEAVFIPIPKIPERLQQD